MPEGLEARRHVLLYFADGFQGRDLPLFHLLNSINVYQSFGLDLDLLAEEDIAALWLDKLELE